MRHIEQNLKRFIILLLLIISRIQSVLAQQWVWDEIDKDSERLSIHTIIVGIIGLFIVIIVVKFIKSLFHNKISSTDANKTIDNKLCNQSFTQDVVSDYENDNEASAFEDDIIPQDIEEKNDEDVLVNFVEPHTLPNVRIYENIKENINSPQAIDLGLSVKWSSHNLCAEKNYDNGEYYKWGCIDNWDRSNWSQFKLWDKKYDEIISIIGNEKGTINGNRGFDAAAFYLGDGWRIPTKEECLELINKCTFTPVKQNDIMVCAVKGINGNMIFIPFAGTKINSMTFPSTNFGIVAYLHTGTLCLLDGISSPFAYEVEITYDSSTGKCSPKLLPHYLSDGASIRPVIS